MQADIFIFVNGWLVFSPLRGHSRKPDITGGKIIELIGDVPHVELFASEKSGCWNAWDNEVESDIQLF